MALRSLTRFERHFIIAAGASLLASLAILDRWIFTPLGLESYGRVWQLFVSYSEFGFVRRGLVGTAVDLSGINRLIPNEYVLALIVHSAFLVIFATLLCLYVVSNGLSGWRLAAAVLFAPTMLVHLGYNTGSLDVFLMVVVLVNILFARNIFLFSALIVTGILIHEVFLFLLPAQVFAYLIRNPQNTFSATARKLLPPAFVALITTATVVWQGRPKISRTSYESIMGDRLPNTFGNHSSGSEEIALGNPLNLAAPFEAFFGTSVYGLPLQFLPPIYVALILARLFLVSTSKTEVLWVSLVVIFPLGAAFFAGDY